MKIVVTGADGFLGWHTRVRLHALTHHEVVPISRSNWATLPAIAATADAIIHIAGVNRGPDDDVRTGNIQLATEVAAAVAKSPRRPRIVFANSIQASGDSPYGQGKFLAASVLRSAAAAAGSHFSDVVLPNLFGEHGQPNYNSFVANFIDNVTSSTAPVVRDREIALLHVQSAAQALMDALEGETAELRPIGVKTSVEHVLHTLQKQYDTYRRGEFPRLTSRLETDLFNALRATMIERQPIGLVRREDVRGALIETVRAHGGAGQTFISTTRPGVTRGQHFHLRKVERFVVVSGQAEISLRRMFTEDVFRFDVTGDEPVAIDMPTLWAHSIRNAGNEELTTVFWTNELFDPNDTDTFPEEV